MTAPNAPIGQMFTDGHASIETALIVPFFKDVAIQLGIFFIPWSYLVIVGSSNAVNLTDGLDGLASGCMIFGQWGIQFARNRELVWLLS